MSVVPGSAARARYEASLAEVNRALRKAAALADGRNDFGAWVELSNMLEQTSRLLHHSLKGKAAPVRPGTGQLEIRTEARRRRVTPQS